MDYYVDVEFDVYRSEICHRIKRYGEIEMIKKIHNSNKILEYMQNKDYAQALYLLGMIDHLCVTNGLERMSFYEPLRSLKLEKLLVPSGVYIIDQEIQPGYIEECVKTAYPEFLKHNIPEGDIYGTKTYGSQ